MQFRQGEAKQVAPRANRPERRRPRNGRAGVYTTQRLTELIGIIGFDGGNAASRKPQAGQYGIGHRDGL